MKKLDLLRKVAASVPLNLEDFAVPALLCLAQGDQNAVVAAFLIPVNGITRRLLVIGKDIPRSKGLVFVSNDIVLEKANFLLVLMVIQTLLEDVVYFG